MPNTLSTYLPWLREALPRMAKVMYCSDCAALKKEYLIESLAPIFYFLTGDRNILLEVVENPEQHYHQLRKRILADSGLSDSDKLDLVKQMMGFSSDEIPDEDLSVPVFPGWTEQLELWGRELDLEDPKGTESDAVL